MARNQRKFVLGFERCPYSVRDFVRRLEMVTHFQRGGTEDEVPYTTERRAAFLKKLKPPNAVPLRQFAKNERIFEATLHAWRRNACSQRQLLSDADADPKG